MIKTEEPVTMRTGDWISLAGLVVSVIGFSVVIRELIRIAHASETGQGAPSSESEGGRSACWRVVLKPGNDLGFCFRAGRIEPAAFVNGARILPAGGF
jgi:hypothetical protein